MSNKHSLIQKTSVEFQRETEMLRGGLNTLYGPMMLQCLQSNFSIVNRINFPTHFSWEWCISSISRRFWAMPKPFVKTHRPDWEYRSDERSGVVVTAVGLWAGFRRVISYKMSRHHYKSSLCPRNDSNTSVLGPFGGKIHESYGLNDHLTFRKNPEARPIIDIKNCTAAFRG
jgi:hypothetical protein